MTLLEPWMKEVLAEEKRLALDSGLAVLRFHPLKHVNLMFLYHRNSWTKGDTNLKLHLPVW